MLLPKHINLSRLQGLEDWQVYAITEALKVIKGAHDGQLAVLGDHFTHGCIISGRGYGKTAISIAFAVLQMLTKPGSEGLFIGRTIEDIVANNILAKSVGFVKYFPFIETEHSKTENKAWNKTAKTIQLPNRSSFRYAGSLNKDKLRGSNRAWAVFDECATALGGVEFYRDLKVVLREQTQWGSPTRLCTTTPMPNDITDEIVADARKPGGMLIQGSTYDNKHLDAVYRADLERDYKGSAFEARELHGSIDATPNALATPKRINETRKNRPDGHRFRCISIDPAVRDNDWGSETGVVLVSWLDGHFYVEGDYSQNKPISEISEDILLLSKDKECGLVVETNNGGKGLKDHFRTTAKLMEQPHFPDIHEVWASSHKLDRALIPSKLLNAGHLHFPMTNPPCLPELEGQFCSLSFSKEYTNHQARNDRVDALAQACIYLDLRRQGKIRGVINV